ncbi:hypothetical protein KEF29_03385 [Streptomyces tuirus]|uniref:Uncharacterized protein n=1 Tax=Streptomyces tuirus TaxID=68278 RepID=A0A941FC36_9ACTN|nr:hypothetical protein [Streptomyces tuirus]
MDRERRRDRRPHRSRTRRARGKRPGKPCCGKDIGHHLACPIGRGEQPAHDTGPSVREAAANDRRWPLEKAGE